MASNVLGFLKDKNILVTGSTGFLGKIFVEKILRTQPGIGRIFVLLRAEDFESAKSRFRNEVMRAELFKTLREQHGDNFENFVFQKVVPVVGDVAADHDLGIDKESTREHLWDTLDAIVNNAANTMFDGRFVEFLPSCNFPHYWSSMFIECKALNVNTKGAENIVEFAKRCCKLQILLYVSTAYVVGRQIGIIKETPMGESMTAGSQPEHDPALSLDIEAEFDFVEKTVANLHMDSSATSTTSLPDKETIKYLKDLGLERARRFGWPNTYTFTKAMGEMVVENLRGNLPVVILRPTIIESTLAEPFPGWMEGTRTIDTVIVGYGKGRISSFLADPELILDVVSDFLRALTSDSPDSSRYGGYQMIVAMATHAYENGLFIYHVASSVGNPLHYSVVTDVLYKYFSENPCVSKDGNLIHVKELLLIKSMSSFRRYMFQRYKAPLQVLGIANAVISIFTSRFTGRYNRLLRNYNFVMYLAELYEAYLFFRGRFDITNTESLLGKISGEDLQALNFDVKDIDWTDYFSNVHTPGVVKYVLK